MNNQEGTRKKTRSQLIEQQKSPSQVQINSQNNLDQNPQYYDVQSSKHNKIHAARKSNWNRKQKVKYLSFLNYYSELPNWGSDLKSIPTFKLLSLFVKSRSPEQCKSFHLSMRRNFQTTQQLIRAMHEELQTEDGFTKLLDRYDLQVISFEEEHKMLQLNGLEEKSYFRSKLIQKCKQLPEQKVANEAEDEYNFKINIKQLIREKQNQQNLAKQQQSSVPSKDNIQPLIGMQHGVAQQQQQSGFFNQRMQSISQTGLNKNQKVGVNFYVPSQQHNFSPIGNKGNQIGMQSLKQPSLSQNPNISLNQRSYQQSLKQMMQTSKNQYPSFPNYGYPFSDMNRVPMPPFSNQMPYSMPPPGGIPYFQGYQYPLFPPMQARFPSNLEELSDQSRKKPQRQVLQPVANNDYSLGQTTQTSNNQSMPLLNQKIQYSDRRKQLILEAHKHYVNYIAGMNELVRRKNAGQLFSNPL